MGEFVRRRRAGGSDARSRIASELSLGAHACFPSEAAEERILAQASGNVKHYNGTVMTVVDDSDRLTDTFDITS